MRFMRFMGAVRGKVRFESEEGQGTRDGSCRAAARTPGTPLGLGSERPPPYLGTDFAERTSRPTQPSCDPDRAAGWVLGVYAIVVSA